METATVEGVVCALVKFDYDMRSTGGPQGTSWSLWLVPDFGSEPVKIKLPDPVMWSAVEEAGFGAEVKVDYALTANVKGTRAVIDRRALSLTATPAAPKARRQLSATA